jgi:hypothetical protein
MREERVARPPRARSHEAKPEPTPDGEQAVSPVLVLQRQAGNRAVGALLAREGEADKAEERGTNVTALFPDPVGVIPVDSYRLQSEGEIALILPSSAKDPELLRLAHEGRLLEKVVISTPAMNIVVTKAVIGSAQMGHGEVSLTIDGQIEYVRPSTSPPGTVDAPGGP